MNTLELQKTANEVRKGIVIAVHAAKSGHPGGSLSAAEIFTYLYFEEMNIDPENPKNPGTCGPRFVFRDGRKGILPEGRACNAPAFRIKTAGASLHAVSAGH